MNQKEFSNYCNDLLTYRSCRSLIGRGCLWQAGIGPEGFVMPPCPYANLPEVERIESIHSCNFRASLDPVLEKLDWKFQEYLKERGKRTDSL